MFAHRMADELIRLLGTVCEVRQCVLTEGLVCGWNYLFALLDSV